MSGLIGLLWLSPAAASDPVDSVIDSPPRVVVVVGDSLRSSGESVMGWTAVLADCLQERVPGQWTVVDRTETDATAADVFADLEPVRVLVPAATVVVLASPEALSEGWATRVPGRPILVAPLPAQEGVLTIALQAELGPDQAQAALGGSVCAALADVPE